MLPTYHLRLRQDFDRTSVRQTLERRGNDITQTLGQTLLKHLFEKLQVFCAVVQHELRAVLQVILSQIDVLLQSGKAVPCCETGRKWRLS